jgi:hypothetical protein
MRFHTTASYQIRLGVFDAFGNLRLRPLRTRCEAELSEVPPVLLLRHPVQVSPFCPSSFIRAIIWSHVS